MAKYVFDKASIERIAKAVRLILGRPLSHAPGAGNQPAHAWRPPIVVRLDSGIAAATAS